MRFFERPTIKHLGVVAFAFLLGAGLGNGYATTEAMKGQAVWLHDWCGQQVRKTVQSHLREDRETFGFAPEDLHRPAK